MQTFLTLSASQSKDLDIILFKNACNLKKDAQLITRYNQSYSRGTSLMVLSLEETIKAILVRLHSEDLNIYKLPDARKFFKDHKIRHQIAQLIEMGGGALESYETWTSLRKNSKRPVAPLFDGIIRFINSSSPVLAAIRRIDSLDKFNDYKNNGLYVGFNNKLMNPEETVTEKEFQSVQEILERTQRSYKLLRIIYNPKIENRKNVDELKKRKEKLKTFLNEALSDYSF